MVADTRVLTMSKSEQPTAARLRRAFREGDVPFSSLAVRAGALLAVVAALPSLGHAVRTRFDDRLRAAIEHGQAPTPFDVLRDVATLSAPILAVAVGFAIVVGVLQTRGATPLGRRTRTRERSPRFAGFLDGRRATRSALGVVVLVSIAVVVLGSLRRVAPDIAHALPRAQGPLDLPETLLWSFALPVLAVIVAAATLDYWLEHVFWVARLRMSPQEIKEERREQEGDPLMRRARRRAHQDLAQGTDRPPH
jgi:flagellar biosynthetic protein FlhB